MLPKFTQYLDMSYSLSVMDKLIGFQSNPELGYRTSGSAAEFAAADYLYGEMKRIGMSRVRKEAVRVDNFEFKRADLTYTMTNGFTRRVVLSAFQARCLAENEKIRIVYVGKGRDVDYEGKDVAGKFVLLDINMIDDWFIYWPVCQARVKKAAGIIVVQTGGYCSWSEDTLGVQDISSEGDIPTFSMTVREGALLKKNLEEQGGEIEAILNADVRITNNGITHCLIGEIPGKTEEVIYLIGHYDAYFTAFADNASGIGCILSLCRAFIESGYQPRRTLRVCLHGAEEWGTEGSRYDWARGATELTYAHPEWGSDGFMLLNLDGNLVASTAKEAQVRCAYELAEGMNEIGRSIEGSRYPFGTQSPLWTWTESYMYAMLGIPTVESWYEGFDFWPSYHSTSDQKEVNDYTDEAFLSSHILYGTMLQRFDELNVRPLDFTALFDKLAESVDTVLMGPCTELLELTAEAKKAAEELKRRENRFTALDDATRTYNNHLQKIFAKIINELFGLDWYENYDFLHVRNRNNIRALEAAIAHIREGQIEKALYEALRQVDLTWYAYHFDREAYDYNVEHVIGASAVSTWAKGKVTSIADTYDVGRQLQDILKSGGDAAACIPKLELELRLQREELAKTVSRECTIVRQLIDMMNASR
ncbi:MAG: M28 family peptidase [Ndongobacter sp.]|nr:M28 family peptidase [Ndongobacter sp.]